MKFWRAIALLALCAAGPAAAQDAAPMPAPMPMFHAPVASGAETPPADQPATGQNAAPAAAESQSQAGQPPAAEALPAVAPAAPEPPAPPQPVKLEAMIADGGQPIADGVTWRIFSAKPGANGQLVLAAKSDRSVATLSLPPGNYVVDAAYGHAQASDTLTVKTGANEKSMVLGAGGLRLNAAVTGDVPIPINLLHFDIFTSGPSDAERALVAQGLGANDIITLNAGTYHIVSYFGDVNAIVRADLQVEAGQLTDATLYHKASQVSFKLVTETGGEAIADVDWTVKGSDGTTIFTNTGAFPSTVLEQGDYTVFAKRSDKVYNRQFQVKPGQPQEIEVLTTVY